MVKKITTDELQNRIKKAVSMGYSASDAQKIVQEDVRAGRVQIESEAPISEAAAKKGFLGKVVGGALAPLERGVRFTGGALAAVPMTLANPQLSVSGDLPGLSSRQEKILRGQKVGDIAKEGLRAGAGIASYTIPGATGVRAFGTGSVRGALSAASAPFSTGADIGAGALLGSATEGVLSNVGGMFRKNVERGTKLKSAGLKAEKASGSGLGSYAKEQSIVKSAEEFGLKGTPQAKRVQVESLKQDFYNKLDDVLTKSKANRSSKGVMDELKRLVKDGDFYTGTAADNKLLNDELAKLAKKAAGGRLTARDVSGFKAGLSVDKAFDQLEKTGTIANPKDAIKYDLWRAVDKVITSMEPKAKNITKQLSKLHDLAPGLKSAAFSEPAVRLPVLNTPLVSGNAAYGMQDALGRTLQATGRINVPGAITKGLTISGAGISPEPMSEAPAVPDITDLEQGFEQPMGGMEQQSQFPLEQAQKAVVYDLQATGGKNYQKIVDLYNFYNQGQGGEEMDAEAKKAIRKLDNADILIDRFSEGLKGIQLSGTALGGRIGGNLRKVGAATGLAEDPQLRAYTSLREGTKSLLARTFGEVGNLTAQEQQAALNLVPDVTDSQEEARLKIQQLKRLIALIKSNYQ